MANGLRSGEPPRTGRPELTGRYLVLGRQTHDAGLPRMLRDKAGLTIASSSDFPRGTADVTRFGGAEGIYLENLGIAVTTSSPDQVAPLTRAGGGDIVLVEPERVIYLLHPPGRDYPPMALPVRMDQVSLESLDSMVCSLAAPSGFRVRATLDESSHTWGLASTGALQSSHTGRGVRVAVLDTGFELAHPDFAGRSVVSHSFVAGQEVHDGHGHGTHCIGTALGPARPASLPRYGIASEADIYAGKVMNDDGRGNDGQILAGINWAIANGCRVVSMSIGTSMPPGAAYSEVYETAAQRGLAQNTLMIAAAGNDSDRANEMFRPVDHPGNCPSIMAVGAVDSELRVATFSARGVDRGAGDVDIVGPGVEIYSAAPLPGAHQRMSGTSMAAPHVAGIAALYFQANPSATARDVWKALVTNARRLQFDPMDVGAGLVQAPR